MKVIATKGIRQGRVFAALAMAGMLIGCAPSKQLRPHDWALEMQNADTRESHSQLADHYEEMARVMDDDAAEQRQILEQYQRQPHKYGKRILDLKARANDMIMDFEKAAEESRKMAEYHRQFAEESR
ncbi:hypothetical protein [Methylomagnum sp.]